MTKNNMVFGVHAVMALLTNSPQDVIRILIQEGKKKAKVNKLLDLAVKQNCEVLVVKAKEFDKEFQGLTHQGTVALVTNKKQYCEADIKSILAKISVPLILILDGVTDPHNLGACLRSADAAGVSLVIAPKDKSVGLTAVARKVACGAAETVPFIQVTNLARTIKSLKDAGIWVYGACGDVESSVYQLDLDGALAIVMGSEGAGIRQLTRQLCDGLFAIPMHGTVESLNVSVATGICLFEARRQRR